MDKKELDQNVYDNYLDTLYAPRERLEKINDEYEYHYFWNKKYVIPFIGAGDPLILDIGCGLGQNLYVFNKVGYQRAMGIDVSPACVDFCKKQGFKVLLSSAQDYLRDKVDHFDVISIYHVVEHIKKDDIINFLKLLKAALKSNGQLIINVPNGNNSINGMYLRYVDITHEILYTPESLKEILLLAGFKNENILVKEYVAYSPDSQNIFKKIIKKTLLPCLTLLVDFTWYLFNVSQGNRLNRNKPVLLAISKK